MNRLLNWWTILNQKKPGILEDEEEESEGTTDVLEEVVGSTLTIPAVATRTYRSSYFLSSCRPWQHVKIWMALQNNRTSHLHLELHESSFGYFPLDRYHFVLSNASLLSRSNQGSIKRRSGGGGSDNRRFRGRGGRRRILNTLTLDRAYISIQAATALGNGLSSSSPTCTNATTTSCTRGGIQTLKFTNCEFQHQAMKCLKFPTSSLRTLWVTECSGNSLENFTDLIHALSRSSSGTTSSPLVLSLEELNLSSNYCSMEGVEAISDMLKVLQQQGGGYPNCGQSKHNRQLLKLDLSNMIFSDGQTGRQFASRIIQAIANNASISSLNLNGNFFTDSDLMKLANALRVNTTLKELSLRPPPSSNTSDILDEEPRRPRLGHMRRVDGGRLNIIDNLDDTIIIDSPYGINGLMYLVSAMKENTTLLTIHVNVSNPPNENECIAMTQKLESSLKYYQVLNRCSHGGGRYLDNIPIGFWAHTLGRISSETTNITVWNKTEIMSSALYFFLRNKVLLEC